MDETFLSAEGMSQILSIDEIVQAMLYLTDLDRLIVLYPSMKDLIDTPTSLEILSKRFDIPYQIKDFSRGVVTTRVLIKSLPDLVLSLRLRDPEERKKSCLSLDKIFEIAIDEDNLKLVSELLSDGFNPEYEGFYRKAGYRGNKQVIDALLAGHEEYIEEVVYGLAKNHHNELLDEYIESMDFGLVNLDQALYGAAKGDNLSAFVKYRLQFGGWIGNILRYAARGNSKKILDLLYADPTLEISKNEKLILELFYGFLEGGHLIEAEEVYLRIEDKSVIDDMSHLVKGKCIKCFLFAKEIGKADRFKIIYEFQSLLKLKDVAWFIVTHDDENLWELAFDSLLLSDDINGLIRLYQHFNPKFIGLNYLLFYMNEQRDANQCFIKWLQTHKPTFK
ncbi:Hypothetical protein POVR1_LOCUS17 [uncultured virus]|nr:Hypothetical protein POVR1_LOCUS17 [uncultured virus]